MLNFCIITGENYISKSLVLYDSLLEYNTNFTLYYFCFDETTFQLLNTLKNKGELKNIVPIPKLDFIKEDLLRIEKTRQVNEFYWTLTPFILDYCISILKLSNITYIDADIYFYANPKILLDELGEKNVLITRHNYSREFEHLIYAGEFCVQFNTFLNQEDSIRVLKNWKSQCYEWCYHKSENGKFGDQGYLTEWPSKYSNVHILKNEGGGLAPWNINKFHLSKSSKDLIITNCLTQNSEKVVFYHFQSIRIFFNNFYYYGGYNISKDIIKRIYKPYVKKIKIKTKHLKSINSNLDPIGNNRKINSIYLLFKYILRGKIIYS